MNNRLLVTILVTVMMLGSFQGVLADEGKNQNKGKSEQKKEENSENKENRGISNSILQSLNSVKKAIDIRRQEVKEAKAEVKAEVKAAEQEQKELKKAEQQLKEKEKKEDSTIRKEDKRKEEIRKFWDKMVHRLEILIRNQNNLADRIENRLSALAAREVDITDAQAKLTTARGKITAANELLTSHKGEVDSIIASNSSEAAFTQIKSRNNQVLAAIRESHRALVEAIKAVAGLKTSPTPTPVPIVIPTAPSNLAVTVISSTSIGLAWNDNSDNEIGFRIERSLNSESGFTQIATASSGAISYTDTGVSANQTYFYRVRAFNTDGNSGYTSVHYGVTATIAPITPSDLTAVKSSSSITLNWNDNSTNEESFKIEHSTDNVTFTEVATKSINATSHVIQPLPADGTHYYRVKAVNVAGSSISDVATVVIP